MHNCANMAYTAQGVWTFSSDFHSNHRHRTSRSLRRQPSLVSQRRHGERIICSTRPKHVEIASVDAPINELKKSPPLEVRSFLPVSMPTRLNENLGSVMDAPSCQLAPKKTHIICTLGPSSRTVPKLMALLEEGMSVARFNFSHGRY